MSKVLITGANGFIGGKLAHFLTSQAGISVLALPHKTLSSVDSIKEVLGNTKVDYIYHCAAYGNMSGQKDDRECIEANIVKTYNLLEATKDIPYKLFINISTSSVYGKVMNCMEETFPLKPWTMYAATKVASEMISRVFVKQYKKPILAARLFSVYGPGEAEFRFIPTVIKHLIQGTEFKLDKFSNHSWIYIDDVVSALWKLAKEVKPDSKTFIGKPVNIGNFSQNSNIEIVDILEKISGKKAIYSEYLNMRPNDSPIWICNNYRMRKLGWKPEWSLYEGLANTYNFYLSKYGQQGFKEKNN